MTIKRKLVEILMHKIFVIFLITTIKNITKINQLTTLKIGENLIFFQNTKQFLEFLR
jgi:hypothetical protein